MIDAENLKEYVREIFIGNIIESTGGETCYNYMPLAFKISINVIFIILYIIFFKYFSGDFFTRKTLKVEEPSKIEYFFGIMSWLTFMINTYLKCQAKVLIFNFCPCHVLLVLQSIILTSRSSPLVRRLYILAMNMYFSPWAAIFFPDLSGLNFYEIVNFWVEHYQIGLINPIVLMFSERLYTPDVMSFRNGLIAHCSFGFYNRIFLASISNFTWANVNYNLCPCAGDPFAPFFGIYYYFFGDFYLFIVSNLLGILVKIKLHSIRKIGLYIMGRSDKEKIE